MTWFKLVTRKENVAKHSLYFLKFFNKFLYLYRKPINTTEYDYSEQPSDPPFRNR